MDSFYGNMVNLLNAQFQFDKFYPNKKAMDAAASTDNVFTGRHALIEYDQKPENYFETENFPEVYYPSQEEIKNFVSQDIHGKIYDYLFMNNQTAYFKDKNYTKLYVLNYDKPIIKKNYIDQCCEISYGTSQIKIFIKNGASLDNIVVGTNESDKHIVYYNVITVNDSSSTVINNDDNSNESEIGTETTQIRQIKIYDFNEITSYKSEFINYITGYAITFPEEGNLYQWYRILYFDIAGPRVDQGAAITSTGGKYTASKLLKGTQTTETTVTCEYIPINIGSVCYNGSSDAEVNEYKNIGIVYKEPIEIFIAHNETESKYEKLYYELTDKYDTNYTIANDETKKIVENGQLHYRQLVNDSFDANKNYYFCVLIANFEITNFETGENRKINEIIDNVFSNEQHIYDFDNTFNYDLTIWRKGHELNDNGRSEDSYREITGYKVPKLDYNLSPDTVLTATPDNKIKGKKLEGSGKIAVNYGEDEVVVSHEKSNDIVNNLGRESTNIVPITFPPVPRGWHIQFPPTNMTNIDMNLYATTTINELPEDTDINYYELADNFAVWVRKTIETATVEGERVSIRRVGKAIKTGENQYEAVKVGENEYLVYITNTVISSVGSYVSNNKIYRRINFSESTSEDQKGKQGILYDPLSDFVFTIPYLELDDYGHAIKTKNTQFVLPAFDGSQVTYALDDTIVNFAKQSGLANKLSDTVNFTIGNKACNSKTSGGYTWSFSDIGFAGDIVTVTTNNEETLTAIDTVVNNDKKVTFYPIASKLKNPISIQIGHQIIEDIVGDRSLTFTAEDTGFIDKNGSSGIGSLEFQSDSTLSFSIPELSNTENQAAIGDTRHQTEINSAGIQAVNGYKIKKDNDNIAFEMNESGTASVNLNKIVLTSHVYGTELPATGTAGQVFFLINETSTNTNN